jgi:hypothetical protein
LVKSIGTILPIFFTTVLLVAGAITVAAAFLSFIVTVQAELKVISSAEKSELILPSKTTTTTIAEDNENDISNKSIIIKQEKEEKDIVVNEDSTTVYEGLGIKLENFTPWTIITKSDKSTCYNIDLCFLYLGIVNRTQDMPQAWIIHDSVESQTIKEYCKCNTLEDYEKHFYTNMISKFDNFSFINENDTTLSSLAGDRSAIQLEYEFTPANTTIHTFTVFTTNNDDDDDDDGDSFYQFIYYADPESFSNYLSDFKKIIDTIEFTTQQKES